MFFFFIHVVIFGLEFLFVLGQHLYSEFSVYIREHPFLSVIIIILIIILVASLYGCCADSFDKVVFWFFSYI